MNFLSEQEISEIFQKIEDPDDSIFSGNCVGFVKANKYTVDEIREIVGVLINQHNQLKNGT